MTGAKKHYIVSLEGFGEGHDVYAISAGGAKYADFSSARDAGYFRGRDGFREYLHRVHIMRVADDLDPRTPEYGVAK